MSALRLFEELARHRTPIGELVLRRRRVPGLGGEEIYEVKLDCDLLMSSLLTDSERALADLAIPEVAGTECDVLVGGLGLGYTAAAALGHDRVRSVTVVELLPEVIAWHEQGLVPLGAELTGDTRCRFLPGDFFRLVESPPGGDLPLPDGGYAAILVDIDHAPDSWLCPGHGKFYREEGLGAAAAKLAPGGVFGFWSAGRPDPEFTALLDRTYESVSTHEIEVHNPLVGEDQTDTVYVARR